MGELRDHAVSIRRSGDRVGRKLRVSGAAIGISALLACAACQSGPSSSFLHPHGVVAANQRIWLLIICGLMALVVLPIFVLVPLFAWRYRLRGGPGEYRPDWSFNWLIELVVWGVPVVIVTLLAILIIGPETRFDPYRALSKEKPLEVDVVAMNWKWLFLYPEQHVASVGLFAFPAGRPVAFRLTSDKSMQSFFIPALGSQIYAMAGMVTRLNLQAEHPGRFVGENTQFNGMQFQRDHFLAHAMTPAAFAAWVQHARAIARPLDGAAYRKLDQDGNINNALAAFGADPSANDDPIPRLEPGLQFSDYAPALFRSVVGHYEATTAMAGNSGKTGMQGMSGASMSSPEEAPR